VIAILPRSAARNDNKPHTFKNLCLVASLSSLPLFCIRFALPTSLLTTLPAIPSLTAAEKNSKKVDETNLRVKAFESMLQESKDKIKALESSLTALRTEKQATIKRTQDVVSRAVRGASRSNRGRR